MIEEEAGYLSLKLNQNKSKLICSDPTTRSIVLSASSGLQVVDTDGATILGSPFGGHECVSRNIGEKANVLKLMGDRIKHLHFHDALVLPCHSQNDAHSQDCSFLFICISRRL